MITCWIVNFAVPADHRLEIKKAKRKYLHVARELQKQKLWNMKVTVIPIVIGALATIPID